ncbi:hypothetical protein GLOIN_2v1768947 [Rhizophagus irregularis DAOM 181602=DAOM 197198]|uniref:Uncharacterized protein n=1 Tax=Rhizophagus irregularis (strain DAOM 181602 / DAOM 197198 / MUCL 43194) TaxID=747089 RepID=A0A2P4QFY4_RHIID|nr:hypothetical protein GLOIN_2v1768947 [Rhizophagus irregularis DAOM 181602=DAOM 197198]POG76549.1 hypothetical protein GLOIN_2v1768947 [Rhizophagus irregularis DAOM 181602=DAOM 197198]|eukprot:XP_025183415.1 hypothetical protein GLOIN_2v1768947 [Rhizophagus irregularis DAOM 181602=DAOM 197198]
MNLVYLFRGYRRSEPTTLLVLKLFIMIILVACFTGYLAIVIIDVTQDVPIIRTSFVSSPIRPPILLFKSDYNFTVDVCHEGYTNDDFQNTVVDCMADIIQPDEKYGPSLLYYGIYKPSQNVFFYKDTNGSNEMNSIIIFLTISDSNYTSDRVRMIEMSAFDPENSVDKWIIDGIKEKKLFNEDNKLTSLSDDNSVDLDTYGLFFQFRYARKIKEVIKPSWMNDFGIPPTYENKSYIESTLLSSSLPMNTSLDRPLISIYIIPNSNTIQIDREVRARTYLNGMGLVGGAWGLAAAIYAWLFGADALRPWGIVQLGCCGFPRSTQKKLEKTLPLIPFFDTSRTDTKDHLSNHGLSLAEKIELIPLLQSRIDSLELFLQEYVVDVNYLNGIRNKLSRSRATLNSTIDTMNNLNNQVIQDMRVRFDNTNSMYTPISARAAQQQQEGLMVTVPTQSNISDTNNTLYDNNLRQQNPLSQQQQQ